MSDRGDSRMTVRRLESEWGTALVCPECGTPAEREMPGACEGCGSFEDPVEVDSTLEPWDFR